jgi:hypothetical protein
MKENETPAMVQYEVVATRRQATNSLMWQTPVLSLTAQAFLFTIALNKDSSRAAQIIAAALALVAALASVQLMAKHRFFEVQDAKWLEEFERNHAGVELVHARPSGPRRRSAWAWFVRRSSYKIWLLTLVAFSLAALTVLFFPALLGP